MVTPSEKFIEYFEERVSKYKTRKETYIATCEYWKEKYQFRPPISSFDSFKKMFKYYYKKKQTV